MSGFESDSLGNHQKGNPKDKHRSEINRACKVRGTEDKRERKRKKRARKKSRGS